MLLIISFPIFILFICLIQNSYHLFLSLLKLLLSLKTFCVDDLAPFIIFFLMLILLIIMIGSFQLFRFLVLLVSPLKNLWKVQSWNQSNFLRFSGSVCRFWSITWADPWKHFKSFSDQVNVIKVNAAYYSFFSLLHSFKILFHSIKLHQFLLVLLCYILY